MMHRSIIRRALTIDTINKNIIEAQYAVRGTIVARAEDIVAELNAGSTQYPFKNVVMCNIGNPQALKQPPLTFVRQVLAMMADPQTAMGDKEKLPFEPEAIERAGKYRGLIGHWTATGAYTASKGYPFVRKHLAEWIVRRDDGENNRASHFEEFTLTNGASPGIAMMLQALRGSGSVMIPIPQYPLYTATMALLGIPPTPYFMDEVGTWSLNIAKLEEAYATADVKPTALVIINPGNPTGQVLSRQNLEDIAEFCFKNDLVVLSDEVYQENIHQTEKAFHSFRKIVNNHPNTRLREKLQVASYHSTSKGIIGECGRRGGYMHLMNFPADVVAQMNKLQSIQLCPNVDGQLMTMLMTDPPTGSSSAKYNAEYNAIAQSLKAKADALQTALNADPTIMSCNPAEGAMYLFPKIELPEKYIEHAATKGFKRETADACWALELLEQKGVLVVPGSGFGQNPDTYHFRTTILPQEEDLKRCAHDITSFQKDIHAKYN